MDWATISRYHGQYWQQAAERHHISGWVRNKTDGSVEMAIQGEPAAIDRFLTIIAAGPGAYSHVTQLVKTPIAPFEGKNFTKEAMGLV
ncbi:acylphosphatase|uniref:Acylphosphatase n=1 Tax=Leuconostoc lactis TaxID=1246 RepID=A0A6L7A5U8_LEULA|nr:acylphosphatase [Leuconostoc lactis]